MHKVGERVGNYVIERLLGEGAQGAVLLARDTILQRQVALKIVRSSEAKEHSRLNALEEARLVSRLSHPNILSILHAKQYDRVWYIVMEYMAGGNLNDWVHEKGPLPVKQAIKHLISLASAIEHTHKQGIVHRDVKPQNVLMSTQDTVKLADFGLARLTEQLTSSSSGGTPMFMPPEAWRGSPCPNTDIYGLGGCLYYMLTGHPPFMEFSLEALEHAHCQREASIPSTIPSGLGALLRQCLAKDPADRPSAWALRAQLLELRQEQRSAKPKPKSPARRPSTVLGRIQPTEPIEALDEDLLAELRSTVEAVISLSGLDLEYRVSTLSGILIAKRQSSTEEDPFYWQPTSHSKTTHSHSMRRSQDGWLSIHREMRWEIMLLSRRYTNPALAKVLSDRLLSSLEECQRSFHRQKVKGSGAPEP